PARTTLPTGPRAPAAKAPPASYVTRPGSRASSAAFSVVPTVVAPWPPCHVTDQPPSCAPTSSAASPASSTGPVPSAASGSAPLDARNRTEDRLTASAPSFRLTPAPPAVG